MKRYCGNHFFRIYKNNIVFCTNDGTEQNTNTILSRLNDNQTTKNPLQSLLDKKRTKIKAKKAAKTDIIPTYIQEEAMKP